MLSRARHVKTVDPKQLDRWLSEDIVVTSSIYFVPKDASVAQSERMCLGRSRKVDDEDKLSSLLLSSTEPKVDILIEDSIGITEGAGQLAAKAS